MSQLPDSVEDYLWRAKEYVDGKRTKPDATQALIDMITYVKEINDKVDELDTTLARNQIV